MRAVTSTSGGEGYELLYKNAHSVEPVGRHIARFVPITDTARMQAESKISCNVGDRDNLYTSTCCTGSSSFDKIWNVTEDCEGFLIINLVYLNQKHFIRYMRLSSNKMGC